MNSQLFIALIKARPSPKHPLAWGLGEGHLIIWAYADTEDKARERVGQIVQQQPYEAIDAEVINESHTRIPATFFTELQPLPGLEKEFEEAEALARRDGWAVYFVVPK